jgi:hypothetical protein
LYDLDYHVAVVASAFFTNGETLTDNSRMLVAHWLKLLQFVAVRPALLADFQRWVKARRHPSLETWQRMPRGYLGDRTHDRVIELLIASKVLYRSGDKLAGGERFHVLTALYQDLVTRELLVSERHTLEVLAQTPANRTMMRGE